jgi:16S rRNA (guanine527-N7)-methyltransferase
MKPRPIDPELLAPARYPATPFPEEDWDWFVTACADFEIDVSDDKRPILEQLYSHLVGVNEWLNLTRLTGVRDYLKFHVLDSLTALETVAEMTNPGDICLDLGSGGGYPGLPLAIWLPDRRWRLVDSRQKKVAFIASALPLTGCRNAHARAFRGREAAGSQVDLAGKCQMVLARAVGRADSLLPDLQALLKVGGFALLLKGPRFEADERDDLVAAGPEFGFEMVCEQTVTLDPEDPERYLVLLSRVAEPEPEPKRRRRRQ